MIEILLRGGNVRVDGVKITEIGEQRNRGCRSLEILSVKQRGRNRETEDERELNQATGTQDLPFRIWTS
ncbi:MAG: hypothetical protein ACT4O1_11175 [Gemmatimonadota bacterium]